jgi:hypothetical protein
MEPLGNLLGLFGSNLIEPVASIAKESTARTKQNSPEECCCLFAAQRFNS